MLIDFDVVLLKNSIAKLNTPHFHDGFEVLVCLNEGGSMFVEKRLYPLRAGTMIILGDSVMHRCIVENPSYERYVLHFTYETLEKISSPQSKFITIFSESNKCVYLNTEQLIKIRSLFDSCIHSKSGAFGADVERVVSFLQLLLFICRCLKDDSTVRIEQSKEFSRIVPVINYIHSHLAELLTLDQLSNEFFISKAHLCRIFKEATGFSIAAYVRNCRIIRACTLLRNGVSVQDAGERVGFNNNAHFICAFKQEIGIPPGKYSHHYIS